MKVIRKLLFLLLALVLGLVAVGIAFVNLSPEFGGLPGEKEWLVYAKSDHFEDGIFSNVGDVELDMSFKDMGRALAGYFRPEKHTIPERDISVLKMDSADLAEYEGEARLFWFGHSAFLLQVDQMNILIDPMLGRVPAPHSMLGKARFSKSLPIEVEDLPDIDAVIISHDHYDHLDYGSISKLKGKVKMFYVPLGVGVHLREWGIADHKIIELDWWQETAHGDLTFVCTPAQHFSGRRLSSRSTTLWSSWVIQNRSGNLFFSGDSGYAAHFKEIGNKYGPFSLALMECGQYNQMWPEVHMFPEETVQAGIDIQARTILPIHWGAFKLAMHPWTDPIKRIRVAAIKSDLALIVPMIGEPVYLNDTLVYTQKDWWLEF